MTSSLTLLVDLDDTLLTNPVKEFMELYLKLLSDYMQPYVDPKLMIPQLLKSTDLMIEKVHPYQTLESVFDADFYPALGLDLKEVKPFVDRFYSDVFPEIQGMTSPKPEAIEAIQHAFSRGYRVVIATNPLFPKLATSLRLAWAGLPESEYPYDLVTSYESMHYAKPKSEYYAEILGQLGWPDQPVCMVGNSYEFDILPVNRLGIPAYLVTDNASLGNNDSAKGIQRGALRELIPWLDSINSQENLSSYDQEDSILAILNSTPGALVSLLRDLNQSKWDENPIENLGSIADSLKNLTEIEKSHMLIHGQDIFRNMDHVVEQQIYWYCHDEVLYRSTYSIPELIDFYTRRSIFLSKLDFTKPDILHRNITHPDFGSLTLLEYLAFISINDRHYLQLIKSLIDHLQN